MTETGDKLFQTVFLIGVFGQDEEELKQALDTIQQVAGSNDLMICLLYTSSPHSCLK